MLKQKKCAKYQRDFIANILTKGQQLQALNKGTPGIDGIRRKLKI